jgi:hypothetical protein
MNIVHFGEDTCARIRRYLDSYLSNELLVETNHEVLRHLESCASCAGELEARTRVRSRLQEAIKRQAVPADLQVRVRQKIRKHNARTAWMPGWTKWAVAVAATLVVTIGIWEYRTRTAMPALNDRPAQDSYILKISQTIVNVMSVGLKDHVHCSVFRKYPANPPTFDEMAKSMGPNYAGLVQVVKSNLPNDYRVIMAHQCGYKGRRYVHLTLRDPGGHLVSLVIAKKEDRETLEGMAPALRPSGIPVYQSAARQFEVAAFETDRYLAYVISDLRSGKNLQIAGSLAPAVHGFLTAIKG